MFAHKIYSIYEDKNGNKAAVYQSGDGKVRLIQTVSYSIAILINAESAISETKRLGYTRKIYG